jgi:truncated hemoglobin YjbI
MKILRARRARPKTQANSDSLSLYDRIGGETIPHLVAAFYAGVDRDPLILPLYGKTLTCAIHGLTDFLTFWLGGPPTYDPHRARLRRRHFPFSIDARARDAWLSHMKAAIAEVGITGPDARALMAHLTFGANALVNTGQRQSKMQCPAENPRFDSEVAERWNRMAEVEDLFEAVSRGDIEFVRSMLPRRLVPHAELMIQALAVSLDPLGRDKRRYGVRSKDVRPLPMIDFLLSQVALDVDPSKGDAPTRFRHLQAMIEAHARVAPLLEKDPPLRARLQASTHDRFVREIQRDPATVHLTGPRGATLLHEAAMFGDAELAKVLVRLGADPNAREIEGHTPLYRAATGDVARVVIEAGAALDVPSGPTAGTPLHQAARMGRVSVAAVMLDHGANIEARDRKGETPLRRAVNCRKLEMIQLLMARGANPMAKDQRGRTPLSAARGPQIRRTMGEKI